LAAEERALHEAAERQRIAQNDFEMAARKYAAVRSMVTDFLGYSPYVDGAVWPSETARILPAERRGGYRFLQMKPREAILAALEETPEATLEELAELLKTGGLELGLRVINAALMRTAGVVKTGLGTYRLSERRRHSRAA
jgi:hypothetical protein